MRFIRFVIAALTARSRKPDESALVRALPPSPPRGFGIFEKRGDDSWR